MWFLLWKGLSLGVDLLPFGLVIWVRSTVGSDIGLHNQGLICLFVSLFFICLSLLAFVCCIGDGKLYSGRFKAQRREELVMTIMRNAVMILMHCCNTKYIKVSDHTTASIRRVYWNKLHLCHLNFIQCSPERENLQLRVLFCDFDGITRETRPQMVQRQKGVIEVQRGDLVWHFGVVGTAWVSIAQDNVMKPVWYHTLSVHEVSDGLQHCLKKGNKEVCNRYPSLKLNQVYHTRDINPTWGGWLDKNSFVVGWWDSR